jgi:hypothetical protein
MDRTKFGDSDVLDMCCGKRKCPVLREVSGVFIIEDEGQRVELTREQAALATEWLAARLGKRP